MATEHDSDLSAELLTPVEARRLLGVSLRTYQRYVHDGSLLPASFTLKGHRRFRRSDVEALVERQRLARVPATCGASASFRMPGSDEAEEAMCVAPKGHGGDHQWRSIETAAS